MCLWLIETRLETEHRVRGRGAAAIAGSMADIRLDSWKRGMPTKVLIVQPDASDMTACMQHPLQPHYLVC